jgi:hypothetical protein
LLGYRQRLGGHGVNSRNCSGREQTCPAWQ